MDKEQSETTTEVPVADMVSTELVMNETVKGVEETLIGPEDADTAKDKENDEISSHLQDPQHKGRISRDGRTKKKEDKSVDHVLRALNSLDTTEEKLAAMCKKYADILDENRRHQILGKKSEKQIGMLQREKEQLQTEHNKAILTRSRLENLCRELQRQNKAIKDESLLKIREEEEKRREVNLKFQSTLSEITSMMQKSNDKNNKLRDDNIDMSTRVQNLQEQVELREQRMDKISERMQVETQLSDARLQKAKIEMAAEKEIMLREKQKLLIELSGYQSRCQEMQTTEVTLRNQISMYNEKYDEFQKALSRSNGMFNDFKTEMEKMRKKMWKLEKESSSWKQRWEQSQKAFKELAADKQKCDQELALSARQLSTLQKLCRTLQAERTSLMARLKLTAGPDSASCTSEMSQDNLFGDGNLFVQVVETIQNQIEQEKESKSLEVNNTKCSKQKITTKCLPGTIQTNGNSKPCSENTGDHISPRCEDDVTENSTCMNSVDKNGGDELELNVEEAPVECHPVCNGTLESSMYTNEQVNTSGCTPVVAVTEKSVHDNIVDSVQFCSHRSEAEVV